MKKLSKILSIVLMVALLVTVNFDVYAKTKSGGFKSSSSSSSKSSSSKSSSSTKSSGGFKSSSGYTKPSTKTTTKPSTSTTKPSTSSNNSTSAGTNNVYRSNNNRSYLPMIFFGNSFGSTILRYIALMIVLAIAFYVYRFIKRKKH